jgi:cytochrome b561
MLAHWATAILIASQFAVAWIMPDIDDKSRFTGIVTWHVYLGLIILAVSILRFGYKLKNPAALSPTATGVRRIIALMTHWTLYALLLTVPVVGWVSASARGWIIRVGAIGLPQLPLDPPFAWKVGDVHSAMSYVLLGLIALHVIGALYGHFWRRERTLNRMLPSLNRSNSNPNT